MIDFRTQNSPFPLSSKPQETPRRRLYTGVIAGYGEAGDPPRIGEEKGNVS